MKKLQIPQLGNLDPREILEDPTLARTIAAPALLEVPDLWASLIFNHEVPEVHSWLWQYLADASIKYLFILWPGGGGKSQLVTHEHTIYDLCRDPNHRTCLIGKTYPQAIEAMEGIMRELVYNELLVQLYGPFKPDSDRDGFPWNTSSIRIAGNTDRKQRTHNIQAYGVSSSGVLGGRYDTVKPDDICTEETSSTPEARQKLSRKADTEWRKTLIGSDHARYIVPGTAFAYDDYLVSKIRGDNTTCFLDFDDWRVPGELTPEEKSGYVVIRKSAEVPFPGKQYFWFKQFQPRQMEIEKRESLVDYNRRVCNIIRPAEQIIFPEVSIRGGTDEYGKQYPGCLDKSSVMGAFAPGWKVYCGADPNAGKKTKASSKFAHMTVGIDKDNVIHIVDLFTEQIVKNRSGDGEGRNDGVTQMGTVIARHRKYGARKTFFENNADFNTWIDDIHSEIRRTGTELIDIKPHTTGKNKNKPDIGVGSMASLFDIAGIRIPYGDEESVRKAEQLIEQLCYYPDFTFDDLVMALWFCVYNTRRKRKAAILDYDKLVGMAKPLRKAG